MCALGLIGLPQRIPRAAIRSERRRTATSPNGDGAGGLTGSPFTLAGRYDFALSRGEPCAMKTTRKPTHSMSAGPSTYLRAQDRHLREAPRCTASTGNRPGYVVSNITPMLSKNVDSSASNESWQYVAVGVHPSVKRQMRPFAFIHPTSTVSRCLSGLKNENRFSCSLSAKRLTALLA